ASGSKAIQCMASAKLCSASFRYDGKAGWYDISVRYFDQSNGASRFKVFMSGQMVGEWLADGKLPSDKINAHSSTRHLIKGLALRPGDEIRIEGYPDGGERAAIDYVEITPTVR